MLESIVSIMNIEIHVSKSNQYGDDLQYNMSFIAMYFAKMSAIVKNVDTSYKAEQKEVLL